MPEQIATWIWLCLAAYASLGALVWIALIMGLMTRIDASAAVAPMRVKAILTPGLIALWPIVLALSFKPRRRAP